MRRVSDTPAKTSDPFAATEASAVGDEPAPRSNPALLATSPASGDRVASPPPGADVGRVLASRFEIRGQVGTGGMGIVYRAYDRSLDQIVALKVLHPNLARNPQLLERFRQEVRLARLITHPAVCRLHDLEEADGLRFLTMELIDGETLAQRLARDGRPDAEEMLRIGRGVAAGLGAAHAQGVLHLDLKPGNVMLARSGRVVVMDFGVARLLGPGVGGGADPVAGTVAYMAPEQLAGEALDQRTDIYALGLVLYEMACGEVPLRGPTRSDTALQRLGQEAPDPRLRRPDLPERLRRVIRRCLQRDRAARYDTVDEVWRELGHGHGLSLADLNAPPPAPRSRTRLIGLAALVALLAAVVTVAVLRHGAAPRVPLVGPIAVLAEEAPAGASQPTAPPRARAAQRLVAQELRERGLAAAAAAQVGAGHAAARTRLVRAGSDYVVEVELLDPTAHVVRRGRAHTLADASALAAQALAEAVRTAPPALDPRDPARVGTRAEPVLRELELARLAARHRDRDRAVRHAERAALAAPTLPAPHLVLAAVEEPGHAGSRAHLRRARELAGGRGERHARLAQALARADLDGDRGGALEALAALYAEDPDDLAVAFAYGGALGDAGRGEAAVAVLDRLLAEAPDHVPAMLRRFELRAARREVEQLLRDGERLVASAPEQPHAAIYLGRARLAAGQVDDALAAFGDALALDPDRALALTYHAQILLSRGDLLGARADARRLAVGDARRRAAGLRILGLSYLFEGRFATAFRHLEDALKDSVERPAELFATYRLMVVTLQDLGDHAAAEATARRWEDAAREASAWLQLAEARQRQDAARVRQGLMTRDELRRRLATHLDELKAHGPVADREIARLQARHAFVAEEYRDALAAALRDDAPDAEMQFLVGECTARLGRHEEALPWFRRLLGQVSDEPLPTAQVRARLRLADTLAALGRTAEARPLYAEFVAQWGSADRPLPEVDRARKAETTGGRTPDAGTRQ
jgi:eukaryotic-like serine/threonine-protein kinase